MTDRATHRGGHLKGLQSQLTKAKGKLQGLTRERRILGDRIENEERIVRKIQAEIEGIARNEGLVVSEHAMLRYLQHKLGIDLEEIADKIAPPEIRKAVDTLGSATITHENMKLKIKGGVVITVVPVEGK